MQIKALLRLGFFLSEINDARLIDNLLLPAQHRYGFTQLKLGNWRSLKNGVDRLERFFYAKNLGSSLCWAGWNGRNAGRLHFRYANFIRPNTI